MFEATWGEATKRLDRHHAALARAQAAMLREVGVIDEADGCDEDGSCTTAEWLVARYGWAHNVAWEFVRVARALQDLPCIREAHREGRLSYDQLKPLTRFATGETDALWAEKAVDLSPARLYYQVKRHREVSATQAEDDAAGRYVSMQWDDNRSVLYVQAALPGDQGARFEQKVKARAKEMPRDPEAHDSEGAREADAMVELVCADRKGTAGSDVVVIHAEAAVLAAREETGTPRLAETDSGVRLSEETVRRIACSARIEWVVEARGRPVGIGRQDRSPPPWLSRVLRFRDQNQCRFKGCHHSRWLKAHHIQHWGREGPTDEDNLVLLCFTHHDLVHRGGWSIIGDPGGALWFVGPSGRRLAAEPPRLRDKAAA